MRFSAFIYPMTVDYDLVIIGGTQAGRRAAVAAAQLQARVALVEPHPPVKNWLGAGFIHSKALTQVGRVARNVRDASQFGIYLENDLRHASIRCGEAWEWASGVVSTLEEQQSPAVLASLGVEVIAGAGEFCRKPHLAFVVNHRHLRARAYLIATGSTLSLPEIEGFYATGAITPADMWQQPTSQQLSGSWVVIGGNAVGTEVTQTLARLGVDVTLVVKSEHILAKEDPEAARLIQAQLEAEGVRVLVQTQVRQVKRIDDKKWVLAGNKAIEADEILLATRQQPNVETLNLEGVGVKWNRRGIHLNDKLQTTNPRIYACGDAIGGYQFAHIADYEARIALKNALFLPVFKVDYRGIPRAIFSDPMLARVGLTEAQSRRRYGKDVFVLREYCKTASRAVLLGETTGLCKIIVRGNGEILGASIVGAEAGELIHVLALAVRQKLNVGAIASLPHISPTLSEVIEKTASGWHQQRLGSNPKLQNFLEALFNWRRSWFS